MSTATLKTNTISQMFATAIATLGFLSVNISPTYAQLVSEFNRGNCGYGRNGRIISVSRCNIGTAINT